MVGDYPLIPRQAFLLFPSEQHILQINQECTSRILFQGGLKFTSSQKQTLTYLKEEIHRHQKYQHLNFFSDSTLLRFLQANKYEIKPTIKSLKKYKKWEDSMSPLVLKKEVQDVLMKGLFYMVGRDQRFRPVIVVNIGRILKLDLDQKLFFQAIGYFFKYIVENALIEGQVQTWITIIDLCDKGMFSLGSTVIDTISFLSDHFRCRLHHSYLVNCPSSISFVWGMVKGVLSDATIRKISITQEGYLPKQAFQGIDANDVELKYGGKRADMSIFWPVQCQKKTYDEEFLDQLSSVEKYAKMHSRGLLLKRKIKKSLLYQAEELIKAKKEIYLKKSSIILETEQGMGQIQLDVEALEEQKLSKVLALPKVISFEQIFGGINGLI